MITFPPHDTTGYLRINELKNYLYCPRISFYTLCLDMDRVTRLAELGIEAEADTKHRMRRRKHALHSVTDGLRHFDVTLWSEAYQMIGQIDEIVETNEGVYLVDYKDTSKDFGYWNMQMATYSLCAAESLDLPVLGCSIYAIPEMAYHPVKVTAATRHKLSQILDDLRAMLHSEICPPPTTVKGKCRVCQYVCFCNDIF